MLPTLPSSWQKALEPYLAPDCLKNIEKRLSASKKIIFPDKEAIFRAFECTPFDQVKVVLLGQDPYHGKGEACGLCFGVKEGVRTPPSLANLMKELKSDLGQLLISQELTQWAYQGVLLLNRTLTVFQDEPLSHKEWGWDCFIDAVMRALLAGRKKLVFVALGQESLKLIQRYSVQFEPSQRLLKFAHPSPLSAHRGFLGSKLYSQINQTLIELDEEPIVFGSSVCSKQSVSAFAER